MDLRTHQGLDRRLWGEPRTLSEGRAVVRLETLPGMEADGSGLVHGGIVFGVADHAAMLAINEPTVVLAGAEVRFTAPVSVGDVVEATAEQIGKEGRRRTVSCRVLVGETTVLEGELLCVVPPSHVLESRLGEESS